MSNVETIDGLTYENVRYNIFAFTQDIKRYNGRRARARSMRMRLFWEQKEYDAKCWLANNQRRLLDFEGKG